MRVARAARVMKSKKVTKSTALVQSGFEFRTWGGARRGAGRKRKKGRRRVRHEKRERFPRRYPVHVIMRVREEIWSLRVDPLYSGVRKRIGIAAERLGMRIIQFSVQGNHIHLIVESEGWDWLARAMKGLAVRLAKYINKIMKRGGTVFEDRYFAHILKSLRETRNALLYVLENRKKDLLAAGKTIALDWLDPCSSAPWFDGWANGPPIPPLGCITVPPRQWLLTTGWKRLGLLRIGEIAEVARKRK